MSHQYPQEESRLQEARLHLKAEQRYTFIDVLYFNVHVYVL